jgi:hypothetical protein
MFPVGLYEYLTMKYDLYTCPQPPEFWQQPSGITGYFPEAIRAIA